MTADKFTTKSAELERYAATLARIAEGLSKQAGNAANIQLGQEAYGIIGMQFAGDLNKQASEARAKIEDGAQGLQDVAKSLKDAALTYQDAEDAVRDSFDGKK
ncbi:MULTISPECIES: type VII secretion target [unclassified Crossiella]|uniref:type VII secretion target n=1 Tax=unclassified Crossiella TaxID=2620835 RepID=UPI00200031CF|nr:MULTISPECIES: type VII secretion target [unclassified Crossiella]MCK2242598.1 type VII secretion target [Crossiella sp. S99.2]MCK2256475.1 type VII secretion target [Crossiella sp. S99.1]